MIASVCGLERYGEDAVWYTRGEPLPNSHEANCAETISRSIYINDRSGSSLLSAPAVVKPNQERGTIKTSGWEVRMFTRDWGLIGDVLEMPADTGTWCEC